MGMMSRIERFAEWLLKLPEPESGEGTVWHLMQRFPWPNWALLLFCLGAVIVVISIYRRDAARLTRWRRACLSTLRLISIALILVMLSELSLSIERTGLPYLVVMLDRSGSMATEDRIVSAEAKAIADRWLKENRFDQPSRLNLAKSFLLQKDGRVLEQLAERHKLRIYTVAETEQLLGDDAQWDQSRLDELRTKLRSLEPSGEETRLGNAVRDVLNSMRGAPPTAVVILSDGITTDGEKLSAAARIARQKSVPIYVLALGNAEPTLDLELHNLLVDDVAFVNDPISFAYTLTGHGLTGKKTKVVLKKQSDQSILASQEATVVADGQPQKLELTYTPTAAGELDVLLEAVPVENEANIKNNSERRQINVRDEKLRVLLVDALPRWEFRELKALLEREKTVELKTVLQDADPEYVQEDLSALPHFPVTKDELNQFDVVIVGDLNPKVISSSVAENLRGFVGERGKGVLFIAGPNHNPVGYRGTPFETLLPIEIDGVVVPSADEPIRESFHPEVTPEGWKGSSIFRFADSEPASQEAWNFLPGLFWMVEAQTIKPGGMVFATHPTRMAARSGVLCWKRA